MSQDEGWVSASAASVLTVRETMKTMVQTTDAEAEELHCLAIKASHKAIKAFTNENAGVAAKRTFKAHEK